MKLVTTILTSSCKQEKQNYFCCDKTAVCRWSPLPCPGSPGCHGDQERDIVKTAMTNVACSGRRGAVSHWSWAQHQHNNRHEAPHLIIISVIRTESTATPVIKEKVGMIFGPDIADVKNIIHTHGRYKSDIQI